MPLPRIVPILVNLILWAALSNGLAAQSIPFEGRYQTGGLIPFANGWAGAGGLALSPTASGRTGTVYVRETSEGILIFARFSGGTPAWARSALEMESRDHVDIWLRTSLNVDLPGIAWGNQFGFQTCEAYEGARIKAADCAEWRARQLDYRKPLHHLFWRQWRMAPGVSTEQLATDALAQTSRYATNHEREALRRLRPRSTPILSAAEGVDFSYFETLIPWDALPPTDRLSLDRIYVAMDILHGKTITATTSPRKVPGELPALTELHLSQPHISRLTSCGYELSSNTQQHWYLPSVTSTVFASFSLENEMVGYRYEPEGLSPVPMWTSYFEKSVTNTELICGPKLRYSAGDKIFSSDSLISADTPTSLQALGGGRHLLKAGPSLHTLSKLGSGPCGSCTVATVFMYVLDSIKGITEAISESLVKETEEMDGDVQLSPDWKTLSVYRAKFRQQAIIWTVDQFCLVEDKYQRCGSGASVPPPAPRQIDWRLPMTSAH